MTKTVCLLTIPVVALLSGGCDQMSNQEKKAIGSQASNTIIDQAWSGISRIAGPVFGPLASTGRNSLKRTVSLEIGRFLDDQDRARMNEAAQAALDTGKVQTWTNPNKKVSGAAKVVRTTGEKGSGGRSCRTVTNTITLADGSTETENLTACRAEDGTWEMQES